jgi:putative hydrolase of HD superfamily
MNYNKKDKYMDIKKAVNFIFELNQLKRVRHAGFQLIGVKDPDSIAEHAWRAAQIGYILAIMEGAVNPDKIVTMILIHDNGEARIGDQHKVAARYFDTDQAEDKAFTEQSERLGDKISADWRKYFSEFENRNTEAGLIAKDADWLEQAFQAKEYLDLGYEGAAEWIDNVEKALETESAKNILETMKKTKFTDWSRGLQKMTYKKINK